MSTAESIKLFREITSASEEQAKFFIDSAKGDVNAAMASYYENGQGDDEDSMPGTYTRNSDEDEVTQAFPVSNTRSKSKPTPNRRGINTIGGLQQSQDEDSDAEDKPAEFYTGGEKSGLGVIDPSKKKDGTNRPMNLIQELLRKAAAGGQEPEETEAQGSSFRGSGYTLGGEEEESRKVEDPNAAFKRAMAAQPARVKRVLKLWQDGFSVDDGQLFRYDDPANKDYLEAINKGHAPLSLLNVAYGQPVDVTVEKRTEEMYTPPPKVHKPFESAGHRLGSETPPTSAPTQSAAASNPKAEEEKPKMDVDESKPTTSLQIRLAAGGRLVSSFNTSHTLADVYDFLERAAPSSGRAFQLLTPFPRKEYPRDGTTLEEAGLLKGVLQQKFT
ncbi:protein of unknown function [Taphrina deformans PYCC 5710]|uniref:Uncharacterized protein n=1 Tax=Taphrina deformans (strain PYCC 5710 / ATCC 11124 / CBS 356.35 / IMI 108563 / JCM 9778 / NBRC 8474) TaxID=1097556 RepID=R4XEF7_TAPDE|nr:protein of unknown function [Taphrina deformans PYCC 5710]|eukprot:CCG84146.1 protein of unknown function [Taphrina deformans PYCC 5710]